MLLLLAGFIATLQGCAAPPRQQGFEKDGKIYGATEGPFRYNWWNYYERAGSYIDGGFYKQAEADLNIALGKRSRDGRRARTYGMHFVDYFPHRELGIVLFSQGRLKAAEAELQTSIRQYPSAKADFYLNKVRKSLLQQSGADKNGPLIVLEKDTEQNRVINDFSVTVKGRSLDENYVARLLINGSPYRFDRAEKVIAFNRAVELQQGTNKISIEAYDLVGNVSRKELQITVDQQAPQIAIEAVRQGDLQDGKQSVTISGSVWDAHAVEELNIGGLQISNLSDQGGFETTLQLSAGVEDVPFSVRDAPGNVATGSIRLSDYSAPAMASAPHLMLAASSHLWTDANHNLLAKADNRAQPSAMRIKGLAASQEVFWEQLFLEGRALDDSSVVQVRVNGQSVLHKPGKQVFFSTMLPLKIGENSIEVESTDSDGNVTSEQFTVIRKQQETHKIGQRLLVSLLPLQAKGEGGSVAELAEENLLNSLIEQRRFRMVERARLDAILREQQLSASELADPATASRIGKLATAQISMAGTVIEMNRGVEVVVRLIDTETSEILASTDVYDEQKSLFAVQDLMAGLALKLKQSYPMLQGLLIKRDGGTVYLDIGSDMGLQSGMRLISYKQGEAIIHPITGKKLGAASKVTGELKVVSVDSDFSTCEVISEQGTIEAMNQVIMR